MKGESQHQDCRVSTVRKEEQTSMADICSSIFKNIPAWVSPEAAIGQLGQLTLSS